VNEYSRERQHRDQKARQWARAGRKWCKPTRRKCIVCGEAKSLGDFYSDKSRPDGIDPRCKECSRAYSKIFYHRPHVHARLAEYRQQPAVSIRAKEAAKRYAKTPKGKLKQLLGYKKYHHRKRKLIAQLTPAEWQWLLEQSGCRCVYCGKHQDEVGTLAQEHTVPIVQGGSLTVTNIRPACIHCNSRKGGRTPHQAGMKMIIEINPLKHMKQGELF
jgi:5-methylcytosine-specific restriction endonuclease McrA